MFLKYNSLSIEYHLFKIFSFSPCHLENLKVWHLLSLFNF